MSNTAAVKIGAPRVVENMPADEYHAAPGLSHSAMKDLIISPLRFWHNHIRPDREPRAQSEYMVFGQALHSATLDSDATFDAKFCCEVVADDYPGVLVKSDDLKEFIRSKGGTPKGTNKAGWIEQCLALDPDVPILDVIEKRHFAANQDKHILKAEDWQRLSECVQALNREPEFRKLRENGRTEVSYFVTDPDTGVPLKGRMDLVAPTHTMDPKTFSQKGKSIDRTIADAIFYEGYHRQAFLYTKIRHIAGEGVPDFVNAFVESEAPHEVRIKKLTRATNAQENIYWTTARVEVTRLIRLYADCWRKFGDKPWRTDATVDALIDEDIPALAY